MALDGLSCGFRLLPSIVDYYAATDASKIHSYIPLFEQLQDGFTAVTFQALSRGINRASHWLIHNFGGPNKVVGFLGCSDLRSVIFFLAGIKANVTV
jgi:hypothetical protein